MARLQAHPNDDAAVLDLARFLIRHDRPSEGKDLIRHTDRLAGSVEALTLTLEADRLLSDAELALDLVDQLDTGSVSAWKNSGLWSLVGSLCLEQGQEDAARKAFKHALKLDPDNQGLRMQLRLMGD